MKNPTKNLLRILAPAVVVLALLEFVGQKGKPSTPAAVVYRIYAGNTHSHTAYTWSHGEQWMSGQEAGEPRGGLRHSPDGVQFPPENAVLKKNWQKVQGPPAEHFALAKADGYDFYIVTDHSQEVALNPVSATNSAWLDTQRAAATATVDGQFVALAGYEHSENNGPGGVGHINVINSAAYLNALAPGIDLPFLYKWLETASPNGDGPVVASFNHPGAGQYNDWAWRDPKITEIITMLEVINSDRATHYQAFINALGKGWKVSPVAGADNHGLSGIKNRKARTFVLATNLTKAAILDAMKHRRTYTALDGNIQCQYTVNGQIMGSTLEAPTNFEFEITVSDPDTNRPGDRITKLDIVKDGGAVVTTFTPTPDFSVKWNPTISDATNKYFFVRVWNTGGGDVAGADPSRPVAWLAPVWTGR